MDRPGVTFTAAVTEGWANRQPFKIGNVVFRHAVSRTVLSRPNECRESEGKRGLRYIPLPKVRPEHGAWCLPPRSSPKPLCSSCQIESSSRWWSVLQFVDTGTAAPIADVAAVLKAFRYPTFWKEQRWGFLIYCEPMSSVMKCMWKTLAAGQPRFYVWHMWRVQLN